MNELNSEKQDQIVPALIEARKEITGVTKDSDNPFYKSKYADLTSIIQAVNKELLNNDLIITQPTQVVDGKLYLVTQLTHSSGQWVRGYLPVLNKKGDDQGQGSGITYARRYGLQALLNIPAFDDDAELTKAKNGKSEKTGIAKVDQALDDIPIGDDEPVTPNRSRLVDVFNSYSPAKQKAKLKFFKDKHATMQDVVDIFDVSEEQAKELLKEEAIGA